MDVTVEWKLLVLFRVSANPKFNISSTCWKWSQRWKNIYFGVAATTFKERLGNHKKDFNHKQRNKNTDLSKYIWSLKDAKIQCSIKWSIVEKSLWENKIDHCPLCLEEKLHLIKYFDEIWLLNKRSEFINRCRHQNKLLLRSLKRNDSMDWH